MNTLPREIVVDVLKRVPFKQLFGHCSLINKEFRALIYNPPIPFPIAADFSIKVNNRFSQSSATKVLDFIPKVDGKRVVKLNLTNLSKMPEKSYSTILQAFPNLRVLKFKRSSELSDEVAQRIPEFCPLIEILSIELVRIERLDFIFDLKYLRELNLKSCIQLSTETTPFEELIKRPNKIPLKRLQLPKYLDNEILQHSGSIFPQLETLLLPGYKYLTDVAVQNMPKTLTELNFRDVVEIEPRHMTAICQQCPKLRILDVWGVKISDESIKNLLENCKELEALVWSLHYNTDSALKMLGGYDRSLKKLVIHFPAHGIKNEGFQALHLTQNRLEELYLLAFRQAPAVSCVNLIEANAPTLRKLIMKSIPYDRQMLPKIAKCKNLTHLAIDGDEQNLELWKDLFASLTNLKWLYIKNTDVLVNLESLLGGCSSLQKLVVEEDRWESPPSLANRNIRLSVTPIGWNYEDFIKEAKAITKQNFGLDQEAV